MINALLETDIKKVIGLKNKDFYGNLAFVMQIALVKDETLYVDMVDSLYEICEKDEETLTDIFNRAAKARKIVIENINSKNKSVSPLSFGYTVGEILSQIIEGMTAGEYLALGCVAEGYISYKRNWLTKDEFYELRDMFVPFNLPISVELLDTDKAMNKFRNNFEKNDDGNYSMALLKKIGKTVIDNSVSEEDILDALNEINFDEAW